MATLLDRLGGFGDETLQRINPQAFVSALSEWATGAPGVTRQSIIDFYALEPEAVTQLDFLAAQYNLRPTAEAKARFIDRLEQIFWLARDNFPGYTTAAAVAALVQAA